MKLEEAEVVTGQPVEFRGKVLVTDPCYKPDTWCTAVLENVKQGRYVPTLHLFDVDDWGVRAGLVSIWLQGEEPDYEDLELYSGSIGVDSGQAGFVSLERYRELWEDGTHHGFYDHLKTHGLSNVPITTEDDRALSRYFEYSSQISHIITTLASSPDKDNPDVVAATKLEIAKIEKKQLDLKIELFRANSIEDPVESFITKEKKMMRPCLAIGYRSVFSASGYGDGTYPCYVKRDDSGQVIGAVIDFLNVLSDEEEVLSDEE